MPETMDLSSEMRKRLPAEMASFLELAAKAAAGSGCKLYLAGGVVRDILLHRHNLDLDLVVEGDAVGLARELHGAAEGRLTVHSAFNTAKLRWDSWGVDLATARSETYARPGALPTVRPGTVHTDLLRRDFTINAMAVDLSPRRYGRLIDPSGGLADLQRRLIRVLHEKSFIDDATRVWRAIRYEQRLGFRIERRTMRLLKEGLPMLATISGDRLRREVELVLREEFPEITLRRAGELGVLLQLHPSLRADRWLASKFGQARATSTGGVPPALYFALLCYRLTEADAARLIAYFHPTRQVSAAVKDTVRLRSSLDRLAIPRLPRSRVHSFLQGYSETAVLANRIAAERALVRGRLRHYLEKLRYVKPALTGNDLIKMGIPAGPRIREVLQILLEAKLDGKVTNKAGEVRMVSDSLRRGTV